jgi:DNA-binding CsgD family transcriptional regulator/tetratricopeptide (TPR) repeat protein
MILSDVMVEARAQGPRSHRLLERSQQLAALDEHLSAVIATTQGRLVMVGGEAGVGKTALVRQFADHQRSARVLSGSCDPLFTPHPLGPLLDVAHVVGGNLKTLVEGAQMPHEVVSALMLELRARKPTVLIIEDVHWADEATLDVLRLLGRRISGVPVLVIATYRDDELDRAHPLRIVLGDLQTAGGITRLKVAPLSAAAVAELAQPYGVDAKELHDKTAGNPFFVAEVLAAGGAQIPDTIRDAVLARVARLSERARTLVEAAATVPPQAEIWLLEGLAPDAIDRLEECLAAGILVSRSGAVTFRHELARLAIEDSVPPDRSLALHRRALATLSAPPSGAPDLTRLAHHAEAAGDAQAVLRLAPAAAQQASSFGAHREAAAQYARALRFSHGVAQETMAEFLDRRAYACYLSGQFSEALDAQRRAFEQYRSLKLRLKEGDSLRSLSRLLRYVGRTGEAMEAAQEAVAILERLPAGGELAMAYCNLSHLFVNLEDVEGATVWGTRALELATRIGDFEARIYALINLAVTNLLAGRPESIGELEGILRLAQDGGLDEHAGRVFVALTWWAPRTKAYASADRYVDAGLDYSIERGLDIWRHYLLAYRARRDLDQGRWDDAVKTAELVINDPRTSPMPRIVALSVLGLVRARRGDPGCWTLLDEAWSLAESTAELQRLEPAAMARAEAAWLEGRFEAVVDATAVTLGIAVRRRAAWLIAELSCWRARAGLQERVLESMAGPYALQISGDWRQATDAWTGLGMAYEAAMALADSSDPDALREALAEFQRHGAGPAAAIVARRLRERGVRGLPRGPRASTLRNRANLTEREAEILGLVAEGLANAEIARRLFLSKKTVDHHVSAILHKLGVSTRGQAAALFR